MFPIIPATGIGWLYGVLLAVAALTAGIAALSRERGAIKRVVLGVVSVGMLGATWWVFEQAHATVQVDPGIEIRVSAGLSSERWAFTDLIVTEARVVDLRDEPELAPRRKIMGTAAPGLAAGWFRLHNGSKAYVIVTDRSRPAAYVPTRLGFVLLLSVEDPDSFIRSLGSGDAP